MKVEVVTRQSVELEKYLLIRGIQVNENGTKKAIVEKEVDSSIPTIQEEMARMMIENPMVTFCVIEECFRLGRK